MRRGINCRHARIARCRCAPQVRRHTTFPSAGALRPHGRRHPTDEELIAGKALAAVRRMKEEALYYEPHERPRLLAAWLKTTLGNIATERRRSGRDPGYQRQVWLHARLLIRHLYGVAVEERWILEAGDRNVFAVIYGYSAILTAQHDEKTRALYGDEWPGA